MDLTEKGRKIWKYAKKTSLGRYIFSRLLGFFIPYSGSIKPIILKIENGESTIKIKDRRFVRNHFGSIHAVALANIAELASGLAMFSILPPNTRGIVKNLEISFIKKAKGDVIAEGKANPPQKIIENIEQITDAKLYNTAGELLSEVKVVWQIGPMPT